MSKMELLSPAGGFKALCAAVQNGANAVYLGEKSFSARQSAENFDDESLKAAVKYAHQRDTKVYLALNTLIKEKELKSFEKSVNIAVDAGVDALIIQDFGAARAARAICPSMPLHASTQMSAHNEKDVEALLKNGFSRIVLARELTREEIVKIYKNTNASLEVFVHGALCICVSGQCLMSSFIGGRSGNRGRCAQPCRQMYTAEGKRGYFLSPRDLCLLDEIEALSEAGVDSLKIEGRLKSPEYVATVTSIYRKYIDNPKRATKEDVEALEKVFVRGDGFTKGYFKHINTPEIMNYNLSNDNISKKNDKEALKMAAISFREGVENRKINVDGYLTVKRGEASELVLTDGINTVVAKGEIPQEAVNLPLDEKSAFDRIAKMGQTPFSLENFKAVIDENLTLSAKDVNALRREAAELLLEERGTVEKRETFPFVWEAGKKPDGKMLISASVLNNEQLNAAKGADKVYMPLSLYEKSEKKSNYIPILPKVIYDVDTVLDRLRKSGVKTVCATTFGVLTALKNNGFDVIADFGLNVTNPVSCEEYYKSGIDYITLSTELTKDEIKNITKNTSAMCEVLAYGRMLLMTTRACIIKGVRKKCECEKELFLTDKTGADFLTLSDKDEHINNIYNSHVTFMADKREILEDLGVNSIRLVFTDEKEKDVKKIISMYKGEIEIERPEKFTRGYFTGGKNN